MPMSEQHAIELSRGTAYSFADWPNPSVPTFGAGVYTIWHKDGRFIYVGMSGRGMTGETIRRNTPQGLYTRLQSHASGRRSGDQFCVYVADRLVLATLAQEDILPGEWYGGQVQFDPRVEAGRIPGGSSYGYRIVRQLLADSSVSTGEREIDPSQAAIIRRVFNEYADGLAPRQIAARLNREAVSSPRGGQWNASTINGNRRRRNGVLNNELYTGRITYNRQRFVKDPETGKRIARLNPEREWVTREVSGLRIIEDDLWERAQAIKQRYSSRWGNKRQSKKRLLSGLLKCGRCGGGMTTSRGDRYYCSARREKSTCDADRGIGAHELEERVLNGLRDILLGNEALIDEFAAEFKRELARLRKEGQGASRRLLKELQQVERGIKRCLDFITGGDGDPGSVRDQLRRLEERKREIEVDLKAQQGDVGVAIHPNLPDLYRRKVARLQQALADETTRPGVVDTIRSLIDRIEVRPGQMRGQCEVIIVGALAQVLAFAQQKTTAASSGDGGTFLMVAGARNHLYRTRAEWRRRPATL
jgi:site-specific DNA recombinase